MFAPHSLDMSSLSGDDDIVEHACGGLSKTIEWCSLASTRNLSFSSCSVGLLAFQFVLLCLSPSFARCGL